ncbi:TIGR03936 family radical SAM-associated protein [Eubacterium pyruvativorans]|uniref:TIGR03936 family radical SAM-associated protein n=1 Tax=Eubacterium pyruvativorans TaxID=155865 RepID=UPI0023F16209|nr:TIGR03936 family radical SAM-associated protein [Eubacterium pyruvativorans]MCI5747039.1 TIGR03936 family radical SAM-associated protein [Eubacterium pyruvativorans]MDD7685135.1 TIGR03936 family radical SAM-associated protein [Eubacterium pyruvativorans]
MSKYVLTFSKSGLIRFTSHLDMLRLFKRGFRRAGIELKYSQGFNPHPRMGFAQPLSLGYLAEAELLEFETTREYTKDEIISSMKPTLAQGIAIHGVGIAEGKKSLAALVDSATYTVTFPMSVFRKDFRQVTADYLAQKEIIVLKHSKKSGETKPMNIREKIRSLEAESGENHQLVLKMLLDQGSHSNLNPEPVIRTFLEFAQLDVPRCEILVCRNGLHFGVDDPVRWM